MIENQAHWISGWPLWCSIGFTKSEKYPPSAAFFTPFGLADATLIRRQNLAHHFDFRPVLRDELTFAVMTPMVGPSG